MLGTNSSNSSAKFAEYNKFIEKDDAQELQRYLMENNIKINSLDVDLVLKFVENNSGDCIAMLLENGFNLKSKNSNRQNIFHLICEKGLSVSLEHIITYVKKDPELLKQVLDAQDSKFRTPLILAVKSNQNHTATKLLALAKDRLDIDKYDDLGNTALHYAVMNDNEKLAGKLITLGASLEIENAQSKTIKDLASDKLKKNIEDILFAKQFPLHASAKAGDLSKIREAYANNSKLDVIDNLGNTPLHYAALNGHLELVRFLVNSAKMPIGIKNFNNETSYHLAVRNQHQLVVQFLNRQYYADLAACAIAHPIFQSAVSGVIQGAITTSYNHFVAPQAHTNANNRSNSSADNSGVQAPAGNNITAGELVTRVGTNIGAELTTKVIARVITKQGCNLL
ncbi:MAG: ankyrin repeat domain-containing protein [Proteobacteria bacterium]|nr:ankyrin repeat domain-containing protein [Pseudomonadota bacterium]